MSQASRMTTYRRGQVFPAGRAIETASIVLCAIVAAMASFALLETLTANFCSSTK